MIPPAAGAVGSPVVWAGWPNSAEGAAQDEPGPDDITRPMAAIKQGTQPATSGEGNSASSAAPGVNGATPRAENRERPMRGPFEPGNDLPTPVDDSLAKPFYRGKLPPPPPDAPASQLTPVPSRPSSDQLADAAPASRSGSAEDRNGKPMSHAARASMWSPSAKMDQIKDLYMTAEAIGEDALAKHFGLVSERQRQLIREYFNDSVASGTDAEGG